MQSERQKETSKNFVKNYKIVVIGDSRVGKVQIFLQLLSSLLLRFSDGIFEEGAYYTVGIDFKIKNININGESIKLQIWDQAGCERYRSITAMFYKNVHGIILNYDIANHKSFESINHWLQGMQFCLLETVEFSPENSIKILLGNKCDLYQREVSYEEGQRFADQHNMLFLETSSKENINVDQAFIDLTTKIVSKIGNSSFLQISRPVHPQKWPCC